MSGLEEWLEGGGGYSALYRAGSVNRARYSANIRSYEIRGW